MKARAMLAAGALALLAGAQAQQRMTLTVRVLTKEVRTVNRVQKTEWLPGQGYRVKVGDATNPSRYCNELHQDPPARVDCAVPYRTGAVIRIEKQGVVQQCAEPFTIVEGASISVTARLDSERRSLSCRLARS